MRVTCLLRDSYHTASGGYARLATAVGADVIVSKPIRGLFGKAANKVWWRLTPTKDYPDFSYRFDDWLAEVQALETGFFRPPDVLHVRYTTSSDLLIRWRNLLRCALVVTFHEPFETIPHRFDSFQKGLGIDMAVVVARSQIRAIQRWIEPRKIAYVPHGIDTDRFRPNGHMLDPDKMNILIVGEHLRPWSVMHRVIDEVNFRKLNVQFHLVIRERFFPYFTGCANLSYCSRVSETELISLYRSADVLFVPMTNATANNSILEALACGTPVISTLIGGVPEYVNEESGWLFPVGDVVGHVNLIASLHGNRELARLRRHAARAQALKFDWRRIAEQMASVYSAACSERDGNSGVETAGSQ